MKQIKQFFEPKQVALSWGRVWFAVVLVLLIAGVGTVGAVAYANSYTARVLPGVTIGEVPIGGMGKDELKGFLQEMTDKLINDGVKLRIDMSEIGGESPELTMYPIFVAGSNSIELISLDIEQEVETLIDYGKDQGIFGRAAAAFEARITHPEISLTHVRVDEERVLDVVESFVAETEQPPQKADLIIHSTAPLSYTVVSSTPGVVVDYMDVPEQIKESWMKLEAPEIILFADAREPTKEEEKLVEIQDRLPNIFEHGGLSLTYTDPQTQVPYKWNIGSWQLAQWLEITDVPEKGPAFGLSLASTTEYLEEVIIPEVEVPARDAKFEISASGKVGAFQASRPGVGVNKEETLTAIQDAFLQRNWHSEGIAKSVGILTEQTEPTVAMSEVNDLGITEVLGTGVSDFAGSPSNRIKNIRHAINKINGTLVPPGEEFSTISHTQPYTLEGGYLPELVIKGDEIKPEIGGGLCQIGSTLFRMAMNSGMPITQRRNHSLVVGYYNDLTNGLPGTDATIYDPAPDFRFKNDTEHHVLVQASADWTKQRLYFTLWGTNDGRKGSYTPPVVSEWIAHGEVREIETTNLEPGVRECQNAYRGANASFTYIRTLPSGETVERVFESYYRPLPQICLVGVAPPTEEELEAERLEKLQKELQGGFQERGSEKPETGIIIQHETTQKEA